MKTEKLITRLNEAAQGLIMTSYINYLVSLVLMSFSLVSNMGLNETHTDENRVLLTIVNVLAALMYILRLYILMKSGQILGNTIQRARKLLEDILFQLPISNANAELRNKIHILKDRFEKYQHHAPITPYFTFSLSNRTFCATLATIITYIVVLIKLRGEKTTLSAGPTQGTVNETFLV